MKSEILHHGSGRELFDAKPGTEYHYCSCYSSVGTISWHGKIYLFDGSSTKDPKKHLDLASSGTGLSYGNAVSTTFSMTFIVRSISSLAIITKGWWSFHELNLMDVMMTAEQPPGGILYHEIDYPLNERLLILWVTVGQHVEMWQASWLTSEWIAAVIHPKSW